MCMRDMYMWRRRSADDFDAARLWSCSPAGRAPHCSGTWKECSGMKGPRTHAAAGVRAQTQGERACPFGPEWIGFAHGSARRVVPYGYPLGSAIPWGEQTHARRGPYRGRRLLLSSRAPYHLFNCLPACAGGRCPAARPVASDLKGRNLAPQKGNAAGVRTPVRCAIPSCRKSKK